jgi:hypothetical protein
MLALSPQHLESGHCISNGESFVAGDLAIEQSARANRLFRRNHAIFQFFSIGLENRKFVRLPLGILGHIAHP